MKLFSKSTISDQDKAQSHPYIEWISSKNHQLRRTSVEIVHPFHCHAYTNLTQPHTLLSTCDICCLFINKRKRLSNIKLRYINIRYINIENHWRLFQDIKQPGFPWTRKELFSFIKVISYFLWKEIVAYSHLTPKLTGSRDRIGEIDNISSAIKLPNLRPKRSHNCTNCESCSPISNLCCLF